MRARRPGSPIQVYYVHGDLALTAAHPLSDFARIKDAAIHEMTVGQERAERRAEEKLYDERRKVIKDLHHRLKSQCTEKCIPPLAIFRSLPAIAMLQNKKGRDVAAILKDCTVSPAVPGILSDSLSTWAEVAKKKLSSILGFKDYCSISSKKLHPIDRLTSRFNCLTCREHNATLKHAPPDIPLSFEQACAHVCSFLPANARENAIWSTEQFVVDEKVSYISLAIRF